jgi:nucleotide-binding universal stress UspA family protein
MFDNILVALDGSDRSAEVLNPVMEIAKKFGSRITLLQVVAPIAESLGGEAAITSTAVVGPSTAAVGQFVSEPIAERVGQQQEAIASSAREYLRTLAGHLAALEIPTSVEVIEGHAARVILDYSKGNGAGLIAMSTNGRGGLRRVAFGSVADEVVRHASVPMLLVRSVA